MSQRDNRTGRFVRTLRVWDGSSWDDGWHDNNGRFRVYRPDYPRVYEGGYALRAHVVWWLAHGECHPKGSALHHKNGIVDDDRLENLELIPWSGEHTRLHQCRQGIPVVCVNCEDLFYVPAWRVKQRQKEGHEVRFCSQECYHKYPRAETHKRHISEGLLCAWKEGRR